MTRLSQCQHAHLQIRRENDRCAWVACTDCGQRGPKKHSARLALARFMSVGTRHRGRMRVKYDGSAARDDMRFSNVRIARPEA